jgi:CheY-like chemotaxis protein
MQDYLDAVDLVLLDMTMPGMTTREIVPSLRALAPSVSILLTSGYTSGDEVTRLMDSGSVQGFIAKPYNLQQLLTTICRLIRAA